MRTVTLFFLFAFLFTISSAQSPHSVLSAGSWHKVGIASEGVYRISYEYLQTRGIVSSPVSSGAVKLYGNGGGMLPEPNSAARLDDLFENALKMVDGGDGSFGPGDYFLFYGTGPHPWKYDVSGQRYNHVLNLYSDTSYYFVTVQGGSGKRIGSRASLGASPVYSSATSDAYYVHEKETYNLTESGREWFGDKFDFTASYTYPVTLQGLDVSAPVLLRARVASRCVSCSTTILGKINGTTVLTLQPPAASSHYTAAFATLIAADGSYNASGASLEVSFERTVGQEAWMDYFELNYRRSNSYSGVPLYLRDRLSIGQGVSEFTVTNSSPGVEIWDITNPLSPVLQQSVPSGNQLRFRVSTDSLLQFVAFQPSSTLPEPSYFGPVPTQDLHALAHDAAVADLVIVVAPAFLPAANELADFRRLNDGMTVHVVTTTQVYNEFSSGGQDVTAIRDFIRLYYNLHPVNYPKYLLLFGNGSFDYKTHLDRLEFPNHNFVPAFESQESQLRNGSSYTSDDFFGLLDTAEGLKGQVLLSNNSKIDIGVGRLPVNSLTEASVVIAKIRNYEENKACMRNWRNTVTLVADDIDKDTDFEKRFVLGNELIGSQMKINYPVWNIDKIYIDVYQQVTNAGQRYPDAQTAINDRMNKGTFFVHYIGHGGETGWSGERVMQTADVESWKNNQQLPVFSTATCTFTRFDNPNVLSAGEIVMTREGGGGIGLFSTVRPISVADNYNRKLFNAVFSELSPGVMPRLGDIIRIAKQPPNSGEKEENILLFGDPSMRMAYPIFRVVTDQINGLAAGSGIADTIAASQEVTISGHIEAPDSSLMQDFNGVLYATIFDKPSKLKTRANDLQSIVLNYDLQKNIIFKGKASITNGEFTFSFKVPLDINYLPGQGKVSYYAENEIVDAHGYFDGFVVGGSENNCAGDISGPQVQIFMNDSNFREMGITASNPVLLVHASDESAINVAGSGIGHDLAAFVDGNPILLNDYYEADIDNYRSGKAFYRLSNLSPGIHTVKVQAWDGCNNMTENTLNFTVTGEDIAVINVYNYPNPFTDHTTVSFEHNRAEAMTETEVTISDMNGKVVRRWLLDEAAPGYRDVRVTWDGTGSTGSKMSSGIYICTVKMKDAEGNVAVGNCKLALIR